MEPFIGQIQAFGFNFPPRGWAFCDGQILPISTNMALFSLLGTTYGGDGRTTFGLPDLRGRSMVHVGNGPGLDSISWGERDGNTQRTLGTANLPSHNHNVALAVNTSAGDESISTNMIASHNGAFSEDSNGVLGGVSQQNIGGNQAINIRNPYVGIYHSIALVGVFPSRG